VVNGAGAAAISCIRLYVALGAKKENIKVFDSKGLIHDGRTDLDDQKKEFVIKSKPMTLDEGMKNADVFIGLSKGNVVSKEEHGQEPHCICYGQPRSGNFLR
jgi:malate dehydrogenase (oxaloacetate-decarboxylating)(NADP+)